MADGVTLSWRGDRYEVAKAKGGWQVTRGGAPVTSIPAQPDDGAEAVRRKVVEWLEANAGRPAADVGRQ
jgi:hypothetical protein